MIKKMIDGTRVVGNRKNEQEFWKDSATYLDILEMYSSPNAYSNFITLVLVSRQTAVSQSDYREAPSFNRIENLDELG